MDNFVGVVDGLTEAIAAELRAERGRRRVPQTRLAEAIGRNQSYVSTRLNGHGSLTIDELVVICDVLGLRADQLLARVLADRDVRPARQPAKDYALAADEHPSYAREDVDADYEQA